MAHTNKTMRCDGRYEYWQLVVDQQRRETVAEMAARLGIPGWTVEQLDEWLADSERAAVEACDLDADDLARHRHWAACEIREAISGSEEVLP